MFRELDGETTLGIGVPGLITADGVIKASPNMKGAHNISVGPELRDRLGIAVHVENDATVAAFGEWKSGAAMGARDAVMVTLGTGIGGGIVMGGQLQRGANGFAGEIGHMVVERDGVECPCGRRGCWERYASGSALKMLSGGIDGKDVFEKFHAGDADATAVVHTFVSWIAEGLASLTNICDPEVIVIGGGVIDAGEILLKPTREALERTMPFAGKHPYPELIAAQLGNEAGLVGVADLARA
jgi:glucokinase